MLKLLFTKMAFVVGGLALSFATAAGIASADTDMSPLINTTCTYPQTVELLNAQAPEAASQLSRAPVAQAWLQTLLGSFPAQRQQMIQQVQNIGAIQPYVGIALNVANSCNE